MCTHKRIFKDDLHTVARHLHEEGMEIYLVWTNAWPSSQAPAYMRRRSSYKIAQALISGDLAR